MSRNDDIDWSRLYEVCVGMIGIPPSQFWDMSPIEVNLAVSGFKELHGGRKDDPMSKGELEELMELHPD
jgi:uncharacterized phage protein (TIGR02216 family)